MHDEKLEKALEDFVQAVQAVFNKETQKNGTTPWLAVLDVGKRWAKVWRRRSGDEHGSIYAFVALEDFTTRGLGVVTQGQVFMPASYAQPAKHARGSVFAPETWKCVGPYGIAYLR